MFTRELSVPGSEKMKYDKSEFVFSQCKAGCIDEICDIQEETFETLSDNTDVLRRNSREMLLECLCEPHYTIGAYHNGKLAGFAVLYVPGTGKENIGKDIGIAESELNTVANIKLVIVRPEYRGNGLQKKLTEKLENEAKNKGYKVLCLTVSPDNIFSRRNVESSGYVFHSQKLKYDNLLRNIYYKYI